MPIDYISSDTIIPNIEQHFRVKAGPGAGKTYWLSEHIKNVLHKSNRLGTSRKIACITYTNIAVETIQKKLNISTKHLEISTIHSFLYRHIVKPYAYLLVEDLGLNVSKMDGHDEYEISKSKIINWISNHPNQTALIHPFTIRQLTFREENIEALSRWLKSIKYKFENDELIISAERSEAYYNNATRRYLSNACLDLLEPELLEYKKLYWANGIIHHDDVLFFSYKIITKHPFVLKILRAKFPYFFMDEFQDSHPIQIEVIKAIGQENTIIGIIGDEAQSIYGFLGATPSAFNSFSLPNIRDYEITSNRRSTNHIIDLLNRVRTGTLTQTYHRNIPGEEPVVLVGTMDAALSRAKELCIDEKVITLSRDNITSNAMKRAINGTALNDKLLDNLLTADKPTRNNGYRSKVVTACIQAIELARERKFKDAIKILEKIFRDPNDKLYSKREALKHLNTLLAKYNEFKDAPLYQLFLIIRTHIKPSISNLINRGTAKPFYENHTYQEMALCVVIREDISQHKTIHKAKGDEFKNVLVVLKNERNLNFIRTPNISVNEEQRICYVAISRARDKLFINVPSLSNNNETFLRTNFHIERL